MTDDLLFVQELEVEIERLRRRASKAALEPGTPIAFTTRETKLLGRAALALGHASPEALVKAAVLAEIGRRLDASRNALEA